MGRFYGAKLPAFEAVSEPTPRMSRLTGCSRLVLTFGAVYRMSGSAGTPPSQLIGARPPGASPRQAAAVLRQGAAS